MQLRIGGQAARLVDETLPNKRGVIGQETTGPGGFAKALRTVPVVLDIADEVRRRALPDAWIVDFTNPVGIVTRALLDEGHRAMGLCNVAIGFQRRLAARFGVDADRVRLGHAGLNHLSWIRSVEVDGVDRLPELLAGPYAQELADEIGVPVQALSVLGAIPSYYLHYFYCTDHELQTQQTRRAPRVARSLDIERELLAMYADPALDHKPALLEQRGGAYYSEAAAALVTSLLTGDGAHHYVDVRNDGTIAGLPDDAVVEVPCHRRPRRRPPGRRAAAAAGDARARPGGHRLRDARGRGGAHRRPGRRPAGAGRPPAGPAVGPRGRPAGRPARGQRRASCPSFAGAARG